jgi:hypothetical protein
MEEETTVAQGMRTKELRSNTRNVVLTLDSRICIAGSYAEVTLKEGEQMPERKGCQHQKNGSFRKMLLAPVM